MSKFYGNDQKNIAALMYESYGMGMDEDGTELPSWVNEFDAGDLLAGVYWWAYSNHEGQASDGYRALSIASSKYSPGRMASGPEPDSGEEYVAETITDGAEALAIAEYASSKLDEEEEDDFGDEDSEMMIELEAPEALESEEIDNEIVEKELRLLSKYLDRIQAKVQEKDFDASCIAKVIKATQYIREVWEDIDDEVDFANTGFEDLDDEI